MKFVRAKKQKTTTKKKKTDRHFRFLKEPFIEQFLVHQKMSILPSFSPLTLMSFNFQTCKTFIHLQNTNEHIFNKNPRDFCPSNESLCNCHCVASKSS